LRPPSFSNCLAMVCCLLSFLLSALGEDRKPEADSLFRVIINNRFGFMNRAGKLVIPARFQEVYDFYDGRAVIRFRTKPRKVHRQDG